MTEDGRSQLTSFVCSVPNLAEYVVHPVTKCLEDVSPYVRRSAVLAVLKLFHLDPVAAEPMLPHLDRMLRDRDPQVSTADEPLTHCSESTASTHC